MPDLAAITTDYQTLLEKHRLDPDDETTWELLAQAKAHMETAWLERGYA